MEKDYGEKLNFDPTWKGPLEVPRKKTDPVALKFFLAFIAVWLGIGIYVFFLLSPQYNTRKKRERNLEEDAKMAAEIVTNSAWLIFGCTILAGILSLIYILMVRWWAKFMAYTIIVIIWIFMFFIIVGAMLNPEHSDRNIVWAIFLIFILIGSIMLVIIFRVKIAITCAMIQEATKTAMFFPSHFLLPLLLCPVLILAFVYSAILSGRLYYLDGKEITAFSGILHFYNISAILWIWNFVSGTKHMVFSSSFATWYWTMNKDYVPVNTVSRSIQTVSKYHLGTVAYGSLIISICQIIKGLLKSATRRARESGDALGASLMACFTCCCESLMEYVEYVNRNAYIISAIHGTDFLTSAKNAFNLIMRNVAKVIVTMEISSLLFGTGMIISGVIPSVISYWTSPGEKNDKLIVAVVVLVFSIILSSALFTILQSAVETIFICVIEDYERNDGSEERPYYMNYKLKNLLLNDTVDF